MRQTAKFCHGNRQSILLLRVVNQILSAEIGDTTKCKLMANFRSCIQLYIPYKTSHRSTPYFKVEASSEQQSRHYATIEVVYFCVHYAT